MDENRQELMEIGADDFISKPFKESELFQKIHTHLGIVYVYADHPQPRRRRKPSSLHPSPWRTGRKNSSTQCVRLSSRRIWMSYCQKSKRLKHAIQTLLGHCGAWPRVFNTRNFLTY